MFGSGRSRAEMRFCAGLSGSLVLSLALVLVLDVPRLWAWEADLELLDLVEEIPQNFYQFLHLDKVSPLLWQPLQSGFLLHGWAEPSRTRGSGPDPPDRHIWTRTSVKIFCLRVNHRCGSHSWTYPGCGSGSGLMTGIMLRFWKVQFALIEPSAPLHGWFWCLLFLWTVLHRFFLYRVLVRPVCWPRTFRTTRTTGCCVTLCGFLAPIMVLVPGRYLQNFFYFIFNLIHL